MSYIMIAMPDRVYDARAVANYLLDKSRVGSGLDPLQVMKLVYIAHGFTLGITDRPLLEDDVEAWQYGPVVRRVYDFLPSGPSKMAGPLITVPVADLSDGEREIVDGVFNSYGSYSGIYLSNLTHRENSPWAKTWKTYGKNAVIPQTLIRDHYKEILRRFNEAKSTNAAFQILAL